MLGRKLNLITEHLLKELSHKEERGKVTPAEKMKNYF